MLPQFKTYELVGRSQNDEQLVFELTAAYEATNAYTLIKNITWHNFHYSAGNNLNDQKLLPRVNKA